MSVVISGDGNISGFNKIDSPTFVVDEINNRVGVGTETPENNLSVQGNLSVSETFADNRARIVPSATDETSNYNHLFGANLAVDNTGTFTRPVPNISGGGWVYSSQNSLNQHGEMMYLSAPDTNTTDATPIERMRIDSNGYVGIGTSSPARLLDVNGPARIDLDLVFGNSGRITSTSDTLYLQGGTSSVDANGKVRVSRFSTTNTSIAEFNVYADISTFSKRVEWDTSVNSGAMNIVDSRSIADTALTSLYQIQNKTGILFVYTGELTAIPFYSNGGNGIAYTTTILDPNSGWLTNWNGSFGFTQSGSGSHSFNIYFYSGSGQLLIQRTGGTGTYSTRLMILGGW